MSIVERGRLHDAMRRLVGCWPLVRGTDRIPRVLGRLFARPEASEIQASTGAGSIRFPFLPGDTAHPAYWYLYERPVRRALRRFLAPGRIFLDVGAHRGWHSGYALGLVEPGGVVVACEPHPGHAERLRRLAEVNPASRLIVHQVAVAGQAGPVQLLVAEEEGWHTIVPEFAVINSAERTSVDAEAIALDDLIEHHPELDLTSGPARVLLKIDAEGAEAEILEASQRLLPSPALRGLVVETSGGSPPFDERADRCHERLRSLGFSLSVLDPRGVRAWRPEDRERQVDLLAWRPDTA